MSKEAVIKSVAEYLGCNEKGAKDAVDAVAKSLAEVVGGGATVRLTPLGVFKLAHREEKQGRNPRTGEAITIAARDVITFKASKAA